MKFNFILLCDFVELFVRSVIIVKLCYYYQCRKFYGFSYLKIGYKMSSKGFASKTPKGRHYGDLYTPKRKLSDSEESTSSEPGTDVPLNTDTGLSLVAEFDDLMRLMNQRRDNELEDIFLDFAEQVQELIIKHKSAVNECRRLQSELDKKTHEFSDIETKLTVARKLLDHEKKCTRRAQEERDSLEAQIIRVRELLLKDNTKTKFPDDTWEKLQFLNLAHQNLEPNNINKSPQLSAIQEVNTTGSLLSDFSYSISEDDLDSSRMKVGKTWRKHRPSVEHANEPATKRRRSTNNQIVEISNTDKVRATTTLTVLKDGPITATSVIESLPMEQSDCVTPMNHEPKPTSKLIFDMWQASPQHNERGSTFKQHSLSQKTIVMPEICVPCEKRVRFGKTALKCKDCRAVCHPECKNKLPLPCIPSVNTPTQRNLSGVIGDYTPPTAPMVPAIIIHCVNEIETRGLNELGIYRVPGSERDVKSLKEKFLKGKGAPCLKQVDVHVICGAVKDFLRSLSEPLITYGLWADFIKVVEVKEQDIVPALYQALSELPQPNRDTLAYMILHLKRVAEAKECKMPVSNLAKVFGPTIVGYSSPDPDPSTLLTQTRQQVALMEHLINLPIDYWSSFVNIVLKPPNLQQTPSTDSLLRPTSTRGFLTPHSGRNFAKTKFRKRFPSPTH